MKNIQLFLVIPALLLLAFLFTPGYGYFAAQKEITAKQEAREKAAAEARQAEEAKRLEIQKRAEEDAITRQKENELLERAKEDKRRKDYEDAINKLRDDIATFTRETEGHTKESADLEATLAKLRDQKEAANRDTFDLAKQVELAKIERRIAEMEIQRMVAMVSRNLSSSPLLAPPPPPAAVPAGR